MKQQITQTQFAEKLKERRSFYTKGMDPECAATKALNTAYNDTLELLDEYEIVSTDSNVDILARISALETDMRKLLENEQNRPKEPGAYND